MNLNRLATKSNYRFRLCIIAGTINPEQVWQNLLRKNSQQLDEIIKDSLSKLSFNGAIDVITKLEQLKNKLNSESSKSEMAGDPNGIRAAAALYEGLNKLEQKKDDLKKKVIDRNLPKEVDKPKMDIATTLEQTGNWTLVLAFILLLASAGTSDYMDKFYIMLKQHPENVGYSGSLLGGSIGLFIGFAIKYISSIFRRKR